MRTRPKPVNCTDVITKDPDCDDGNPQINIVKAWFLDKDGDGYFAAVQMATSSPGTGWTNIMTKGLDCDDNNATIPLLLSCFFKSPTIFDHMTF